MRRAYFRISGSNFILRIPPPANIIYDEASNTAKLTDFGVACLTDASKTKTGTVGAAKAHGVHIGEGADQCAHLVWHFE